MKSFVEYITERQYQRTDRDKPKITTSNEIDVFMSRHADQRKQERHPQKDKEFILSSVEKMTDFIKKNLAKVGQVGDGEFLFKIKSIDQSFILSYRRSYDEPSIKKKNLYIVTILPTGRHRPKQGTQAYIVENIDEMVMFEVD